MMEHWSPGNVNNTKWWLRFNTIADKAATTTTTTRATLGRQTSV